MRLPVFVLLSLLATIAAAAAAQTIVNGWRLKNEGLAIRTGVTDGMAGREAVMVSGDAGRGGRQGSLRYPLAQAFSLLDWRGKRVRVTFRLKTEDEMRARVLFELAPDGSAASQSMLQNQDSPGWEVHSFVADVPRRDISHLHILVGLLGKGAVWIDDVAIEAVDRQIALTPARRLDTGAGSLPGDCRECYGSRFGGVGNYDGFYNLPVQAPSPVGTGVINK
jgi:hypothetical protein